MSTPTPGPIIEPPSVRVARGMARLDQGLADWWRADRQGDAINLETLNISSGCECVGGQLGWHRLVFDVIRDESLVTLGFFGLWWDERDKSAYHGDCAALTEMWRAAILARREGVRA